MEFLALIGIFWTTIFFFHLSFKLYRFSKDILMRRRYVKKRKEEARIANLEYHKIKPTLSILNELIERIEKYRVTTICVPNTVAERATWNETNRMIDRMITDIKYFILVEENNCQRRSELNEQV